MIANFEVSRVLIDGDSSCDIVYSDLFEKIKLKKEKLWPYEWLNLQVFNGMVTRLWGYIGLMVILGEEGDTIVIDYQFLVVSSKSVYNGVLGWSFASLLDVIASPVYLKLKYHIVPNMLMIIRTNLSGAKRIYKYL